MADKQEAAVRLAVIGAGLIGEKHARLIRGGTACTLAGICDVDPGRRCVAEASASR